MTFQLHRILRWLLFLWVKVEVFPRENPPFDLDTSLPTLYILADRGLSDLLVLTHTTNQLDLPSPLARSAIPSATYHHSVYCIASPNPLTNWIRRRKKHSTLLQDFIYALQSGKQTKLQIVPVSVFWGRPLAKQKHWSQVLFADTWVVAGRIRKFFTLLIHGRNTRLIFSQPLSFELLARECNFSDEDLHNHLLNLLTQQREATFGPQVSRHNQLTNAVINTPEVQQLLVADNKGLKKAKAYCKEIFADCTQLTIEIMLRLLRLFWRRFYTGIDTYNVNSIKQMALTHQLVYVPCHRSHVDYLLLSYIIFIENLAIPYIASGSNLNMPIIGRVLRGGGAFFMRRSFKDNPLYGAVMHAYIEQLITLGVPIEYFIEGGRSRTGRLLKPRLGMLNMTVDAYIKTQSRPLAFVPVYIGYEKLIEGRSYLGELYGEKKKRESLFGAIAAIFRLKGNFGQVTCSFGTAIVLSDILDQHSTNWTDSGQGGEHKPDWYRSAIDALSQQIMIEINRACVINPVNMVATILLATPRQSIDLKELVSQFSLFSRLITSVEALSSIRITSEIDQQQIESMAKTKLLHIRQHALGNIVYLKPEDSVLMSYYRNNSLHAFVIPALIACCFANTANVQVGKIKQIIRVLYPFLKAELHLEWSIDKIDMLVNTFSQAMINAGLLRKSKTGIRRPERSARRYMDLMRLILVVQPILERYYMTFIVLWQSARAPMSIADLEQRCHLLAQKVSMLHGINAPDFFDRQLFRQFIETMIETEYLQQNENAELAFSDDFDHVNVDIRSLLSIEVRCTILSMIRG